MKPQAILGVLRSCHKPKQLLTTPDFTTYSTNNDTPNVKPQAILDFLRLYLRVSRRGGALVGSITHTGAGIRCLLYRHFTNFWLP